MAANGDDADHRPGEFRLLGARRTPYQLEKHRWYDRIIESRRCGSSPTTAPRVIDTDMFTPTTIVRFTGHDNGAVYGAPEKQLDGTTHLENLFVCGTDQGFVGIVGSDRQRHRHGEPALPEVARRVPRASLLD